MGPPWLRTHLGQIERGNIERVPRQFNGTQFAVVIKADKAQIALLKVGGKTTVEAIVAEEIFARDGIAIKGCHLRIGYQLDCLFLPRDRTGDLVNQERRRVRRTLFVVSVTDIKYSAGILYQSMLEAPSGAKERNTLFACKTNGCERTVHAGIGATG